MGCIESCSPEKVEITTKKLLTESPRRRKTEGVVGVPFLGALPGEEWEVHHQDHENRTGCGVDRVFLRRRSGQ